MLKCVSKTFSRSFTGYVMDHGIQFILFQTFDKSEVESLCKEFSISYPNIYVEEMFCSHCISKFRLS